MKKNKVYCITAKVVEVIVAPGMEDAIEAFEENCPYEIRDTECEIYDDECEDDYFDDPVYDEMVLGLSD